MTEDLKQAFEKRLLVAALAMPEGIYDDFSKYCNAYIKELAAQNEKLVEALKEIASEYKEYPYRDCDNEYHGNYREGKSAMAEVAKKVLEELNIKE